MASRATIDGFLAQRTLALVGVSRSGRKFGNAVLRELSGKGYRVLPVHPEADEIDGTRCWPDLRSLPQEVGGVVVVVPPDRAAKVVEEAADAGIPRVWLQQGAGSPDVVRAAEERGLEVVDGECILMFAEPTAFFHRAHRFIRGAFGRLPQ
jgi:predicted CoA-binding protein